MMGCIKQSIKEVLLGQDAAKTSRQELTYRQMLRFRRFLLQRLSSNLALLQD